MSLDETPLWRNGTRKCTYCDIPLAPEFASRDHVVPRSLGGKGNRNIVLACRKCNSHKGSMPVEAFLESSWLEERRRRVQRQKEEGQRKVA